MPDKPELPQPYVPASLDFGDERPAAGGMKVAVPRTTGAPVATGLAPGKSGKLYRLGLVRDNDLMYYVSNGDVWAVRRKKPGEPKGEPFKVVSLGFEMDYGRYLYFLDGDGDLSVRVREVSGGG